MAPVAVGVAAVLIAAGSAPASADQVRHSEWWLAKLHVTAAQATSLGSGVTVAVLSTGSDTTAPDIAGSVSAGPDFSRSGRSQGGPFYGILGTEIDSIIAGHGHGPGHAEGVLGVAPAAKIISIRVGLDSGDPQLSSKSITAGLPDAIAQGIRAAVQTGASVIDLPRDPAAGTATGGAGVTGLTDPSPAEKSAIAFAIRKGAVLIAPAGDDAAGNHGVVNYPAAFPGVISVGGFNSNLVKAPFSSREPYVTLTAAGVGVPAESPTGYTTVNSTAAAAAVVAGVAALIRSAFPALTPKQVTAALISSTRFHHAGRQAGGSGHGVVDASAALAAATATAEPHGKAADAGAVPRVSPVVPAVASPRATLSHKIKQDAVLSGAVLLGLLVLVGLFALLRRLRRGRHDETAWPPDPVDQPAMAAAGAGRDGQPQFLPAPGARPETMAAAANGYDSSPFEPQPFTAQPFGSPALAAPGSSAADPFGGPQDLNGHGSFNGASGGAPSGAGSAPFGAASAPFGPVPAGGKHSTADAPSRPRPGIGSRPTTTRAKVTGAPPWEPAAKPDSELPWAATPSPSPAAAAEQDQAPPAPAQPQRSAPPQFTAQPQFGAPTPFTAPPQQSAPPQDPAPPQFLTAQPPHSVPPEFAARPPFILPPPFAAQPPSNVQPPLAGPPQFGTLPQRTAPPRNPAQAQHPAQAQYSAAADSVWDTNAGSTDAIWDTAGPPARDPNGRREFTGAQDLSPDQGRAGQQAWGQPDAAERAEATETFPAYPSDEA
jgi:serine protease